MSLAFRCSSRDPSQPAVFVHKVVHVSQSPYQRTLFPPVPMHCHLRRSRGHFFGEEAILTQARAISTVRALTYLDVFFLTKESLLRILDSGDFSETRKKIRYAVIRMALRRELLKCAALARIRNGLFRIAQGGELAYVPDPTADVELDQHSDVGPSATGRKQAPAKSSDGNKPKGSHAVGRPPSPPPAQLLALVRTATEHRSRRSSLGASPSSDAAEDASLRGMVTMVSDHGALTTGRGSGTSGSQHGRPLSRQQRTSGEQAASSAGRADFPATVGGGHHMTPAIFFPGGIPDLMGEQAAPAGFERSPSAQARSSESDSDGDRDSKGAAGNPPPTVGDGDATRRDATDPRVAATSSTQVALGILGAQMLQEAMALSGSGTSIDGADATSVGPEPDLASSGHGAGGVAPFKPQAAGRSHSSTSRVEAHKLAVSRSGRTLTAAQRQALARDAQRMSRRMPALARQMSRAALAKADSMPGRAKQLQPALRAPLGRAGEEAVMGARGWGEHYPGAGAAPAGAARFSGMASAFEASSSEAGAAGAIKQPGYDRGLMQRMLKKATESHASLMESSAHISELSGQVQSLERIVGQSLASIRTTQFISAAALLLSLVVLILVATRSTM